MRILFVVLLAVALAASVTAQSSCGKNEDNKVCTVFGQCCSKDGVCGTSAAECGDGCQPGFGACNALSPVLYTCENSDSGKVALTFDDGPGSHTDELLDLLKTKNVKATFFVNGDNLECIYNWTDTVKRIVDEGHQIGSHTWSHPHVPEISDEQIMSEMTKVETALREITGHVPSYMRLPFGEGNGDARVLGILDALDYKVAQWDLDSGDALGLNANEQKQEYEKNAVFPASHIAINHDVKELTVNSTIPFALDLLISRGYKLVTVAECVGDTKDGMYKEITTPSGDFSRELCTKVRP